MLIRFTLPESSDAAGMAVLPPQRRIDVTCRIERSDEFVTVPLDPWGNSLERARLSLIRLNECGKGAHDLASLHRTMLIHPAAVGQDCR